MQKNKEKREKWAAWKNQGSTCKCTSVHIGKEIRNYI